MNRILRYLAQFAMCEHNILYSIEDDTENKKYTITVYEPGTGTAYDESFDFDIEYSDCFKPYFQTYFVDLLAQYYYGVITDTDPET